MNILITLGATIGIITGIILFFYLIGLVVYLDDKYGFVIPLIFLFMILICTFINVHDVLVEKEIIEPFLNYWGDIYGTLWKIW